MLLGILIVQGCGRPGLKTAPVTGVVTYNGEPLRAGTIMFIPDSGPYASGTIQSDGAYSLETFRPGDGAVLGHHSIMINAVDIPNPDFPAAVPLLPDKFGSVETSGLEAVIEDQPNVVNLDLEGPAQLRRSR